jgi:hypothetical protein
MDDDTETDQRQPHRCVRVCCAVFVAAPTLGVFPSAARPQQNPHHPPPSPPSNHQTTATKTRSRTPNEPCTLAALRELGVLSWRLDADAHETDPKLAAIRKVRGYSWVVVFFWGLFLGGGGWGGAFSAPPSTAATI